MEEPCEQEDEMSREKDPDGCQPETDPMSGSTPSNRLAKRRFYIEGQASLAELDSIDNTLSLNTRDQRTTVTAVGGELSTAGQRARPGDRDSSPGSTQNKAKRAKTTCGEVVQAGDATGDDVEQAAAASTTTRGKTLVKKSTTTRGAEASGIIVDATVADIELSSTPLPTDGTGVLRAYTKRMKIDARTVLYSVPSKQVPILNAYLASPVFTDERFSVIGDVIARSRATRPSRPDQSHYDAAQANLNRLEVADNPEVAEAQNLLKPAVEELWQTGAVIRQWIKLVTPRLLDYGADGATRDALAELAELAHDMDDTVQQLDEAPSPGLYHRDRADFAIAMVDSEGDEGATSAYEKVIADHDWLCLYNVRTAFVVIRDHYLALHDFVEKNAHYLNNSKIFA